MNHSAFSLPPQVLVVGDTTQGGVSKVSYREVKAQARNQAVSASSSSLRLHSISPPSIVNFENGDIGVSVCSAEKNCESPGLFRKNRMWLAVIVSLDSQIMPENSATIIWAYWPASAI